jgi:hypothetical protein
VGQSVEEAVVGHAGRAVAGYPHLGAGGRTGGGAVGRVDEVGPHSRREGLDGVAHCGGGDQYVQLLVGLEAQAWHGRRL